MDFSAPRVFYYIDLIRKSLKFTYIVLLLIHFLFIRTNYSIPVP